MKKITAATVIFLAMVTVLFSGMAQAKSNNMIPVAGYEEGNGGGAGAPYFIPGKVTANGYDVTLKSAVAVFVEAVPGVKALDDPARKGEQVWVVTYTETPAAFDGATLYAIKMGKDFVGEGQNLYKVDLTQALSSAAIVGGIASFHCDRKSTESYWQPATWVIAFPDGKRAWGGQPGYPDGPWLAHNKNNAPLTVWGVTNGGIIKPTKEVFQFFRDKF